MHTNICAQTRACNVSGTIGKGSGDFASLKLREPCRRGAECTECAECVATACIGEPWTCHERAERVVPRESFVWVFCGLYTYGLYGYGLYSYGLCKLSYGLVVSLARAHPPARPPVHAHPHGDLNLVVLGPACFSACRKGVNLFDACACACVQA